MLKNIEWMEFLQEIKKCEYIICIGSGKRLDTFREFFEDDILQIIL